MSTEAATLDLKKTVNLPKTNFGQKANLPQTEPARLKKWADMNLYGQIGKARAGAPKFIHHDVRSLRGRDGASVCAFRRARFRLQRRAPGLLVYSRSDGVG